MPNVSELIAATMEAEIARNERVLLLGEDVGYSAALSARPTPLPRVR